MSPNSKKYKIYSGVTVRVLLKIYLGIPDFDVCVVRITTKFKSLANSGCSADGIVEIPKVSNSQKIQKSTQSYRIHSTQDLSPIPKFSVGGVLGHYKIPKSLRNSDDLGQLHSCDT